MIQEITLYETTDGRRHDTLQLAHAHERFSGLSSVLDNDLCLRDVNSDDIVKWIVDNAEQVREFLAALKPAL